MLDKFMGDVKTWDPNDLTDFGNVLILIRLILI